LLLLLFLIRQKRMIILLSTKRTLLAWLKKIQQSYTQIYKLNYWSPSWKPIIKLLIWKLLGELAKTREFILLLRFIWHPDSREPLHLGFCSKDGENTGYISKLYFSKTICLFVPLFLWNYWANLTGILHGPLWWPGGANQILWYPF